MRRILRREAPGLAPWPSYKGPAEPARALADAMAWIDANGGARALEGLWQGEPITTAAGLQRKRLAVAVSRLVGGQPLDADARMVLFEEMGIPMWAWGPGA